MKELLLIPVVGMLFLFGACEKEYTCTCTTVDSSGTTPTSTTSVTFEGTGSEAKDACEEGEVTNGTLTTTCKLD